MRVVRLGPLTLPFLGSGGATDVPGRSDPSERGRAGALRFNPPARTVDPGFFQKESFARLAAPVQASLRGLLALVPDRAPDLERLIELPSFSELSAGEQRALLDPPRPERLDHALAILEHPLWPSLSGDKLPLFSQDLRVQRAVLQQFEHFPTMRAGESLCSLMRAPWLAELSTDDRIRAVKVIAYAASQLTGASFEDMGVSQKRIIESSIDGLLSGRFTLELEDLPFGEHDTVAGLRRLPGTVVLNRRAIPADGSPIDGQRQEHVALATLVHEINHLVNAVPEGPTYAAFQDEYRAWFVAFVAFMARFPTKIEALSRAKELLSNPAYPDLQEAARSGTEESKQIFRFLSSFGDVRSLDDLFALQLDNFVLSAPLPDPMLEMNNQLGEGSIT